MNTPNLKIGAIAILATFATANYAGQQNNYLLRLRLNPGAKTTYAMSMVMKMDMSKVPQNGGQQMPKSLTMNMNMGYSMTLQKKDAGKHTFKMLVKSASMKSDMPGMPDMSKEMAGKSAVVVTNDRGKILSVTGDAKLGMNGMSNSGFTGVVFPEKAVTIGSKWSESVSSQGMTMTMNYKVLGKKSLGNTNLLVISGNVTGSQMLSSPTPIMFTINATTGELVSSSGKLKMNTMGMAGDMSFSVKKQ